jgi:queuine tRNA-ribosyltransferase
MNKTQKTIIPVFTTPAGSCLTNKNWEDAGVKIASFHLAALLMKPGYDVLKTLPDLKTYTGWSGTTVLNASIPRKNNGVYEIRSTYDGQIISLTREDLFALVAVLKPDRVILPEEDESLWEILPETTTPFFPSGKQPLKTKRAYGVYFFYNPKSSVFSEFINTISLHKEKHCYVAGDFNPSQIAELASYGVIIETNKPADDAYKGQVYCEEGELSIQSDSHSTAFELITKNCLCATCRQGFTRAYLHHLFTHTPLLCQRFLVEHNMAYLNG